MKFDDAKRLLKNPQHQISYLCINHLIERDCDVHLVASAFPNLTELVIFGISVSKATASRKVLPKKRLWRNGSVEPEDQKNAPNLDSSFKMLVENTPHLKHLTIDANRIRIFDEDALYQIPGWKNLKTLRLRDIRLIDGDFLIQIGRKCKDLEVFELSLSYYCLLREEVQWNTDALTQMMQHCHNLKEFSISTHEPVGVSGLFTALANHQQLEKVYGVLSWYEDTVADLVLSIELLLHQCSKLTTFCLLITCESENLKSDELLVAEQRWNKESIRPNFQMRMFCRSLTFETLPNIGTVHKDTPPRSFF